MELPAQPAESQSVEERTTLCYLFGNAFTVARSEFSNLWGYVYAQVWGKFVVREAYAAQVVYTEAGEVQATDEQLVENGQCLLNVRLSVAEHSGTVTQGAVRFKANESVWLSRSDDSTCYHPRALKIDRVQGQVLYFTTKSRYPEDAEEGLWRLDVGINEHQVLDQLQCIKKFALNVASPLYSVIVQSSAPSPATMPLLPSWETLDHVLSQQPGLQRLNAQQIAAVQMSLDHHVVLIQGPPGTGKTTTAAALMIVHAMFVKRLLVVFSLVHARESRCVASVS